MPLTCKCQGCPTPPKPDHAFCSWCTTTLFVKKLECHGNRVCFERPCAGRMLIKADYWLTHLHELRHADPFADDEKALRRAGLRRHPDAVSPMDSFDSQ